MSSDPYREPGKRDDTYDAELDERWREYRKHMATMDKVVESLRVSIMKSQYLGIYRG